MHHIVWCIKCVGRKKDDRVCRRGSKGDHCYSLHTLGSERQFWTPFKLQQKQKIKALSKDLDEIWHLLHYFHALE